MALSTFAIGAELVVCQCCSGRIAEKDGDDGKDAAAGSSGKREQMGEGDSTKVEAVQRRRQDRNEKKKRLKCTLLNGSAWSTERKYRRRYKGTFDIFFGMEHRSQVEEGGNGGGVQQKRRRKDGGLRLTRRESRTKEHAARIKSIHQEECLLQSTAIWEESLERKKEQLCPSQGTKGELPKYG